MLFKLFIIFNLQSVVLILLLLIDSNKENKGRRIAVLANIIFNMVLKVFCMFLTAKLPRSCTKCMPSVSQIIYNHSGMLIINDIIILSSLLFFSYKDFRNYGKGLEN